jgi:uncharacterized protein (DUF342 family)
VKARVPLSKLTVGMFVVAEVRFVLKDRSIRHFLELTDAEYEEATSKRLRLKEYKSSQVANAGGMLMTSSRQVETLRELSVTSVIIDTDKSDVVPDDVRPVAITESPDEADALVVDAINPTRPAAEDETEQQTIDVPGSDRRKNFGPDGLGWMKVELTRSAEDGALIAFLQVLSFGGDGSMTSDHVQEALEELYGIRTGLDLEMVTRLAKQAAASPNRVIRGQFALATIDPPNPSDVGRIELTAFESTDASALDAENLVSALGQPTLRDVLNGAVRVRSVMPGEQLAIFVADENPPPHLEIFGADIPLGSPETLLRAGAHVRLEGERYVAETYGYLCLQDETVSVIPPVWMSEDRMEAHYIHFPDVGPGAAMTWDWLMGALESAGVCYGLREDALRELTNSPPRADEVTSRLVAVGDQPQEGTAPSIRLLFGSADEGALRRDGQLDVSAHHNALTVRNGDLLAEVTRAKAPRPGTDLTGARIEPTDGDIPGDLESADSVRREEEGPNLRFYAAEDGRASVKDNVLRVQPVLDLPGSVETPLEVEEGRDLIVRGSIRRGAVVRAGGSISVVGMIEGGANVQAREDICVEKGVVGRDTKVVSLANVQTRYVQASSIVAGGTLTITSHLMNAQVRAETVHLNGAEGAERAGSIVGGQVFAIKKLTARLVNAVPGRKTEIGIAPDPRIAARLRKLDKGIEFCRSNILRIFRTLGIDEIDAVSIRKMIDSQPEERQKGLRQLLGQLQQLADTREKSVKLRSELLQERQRRLKSAEIEIGGEIVAGVDVRYGESLLTMDRTMPRPVYQLDDEGTISVRTA